MKHRLYLTQMAGRTRFAKNKQEECNMKRIIALILCIVMSLTALTGCGKDKDANAKGDWDGKITIGIPDNALVQHK